MLIRVRDLHYRFNVRPKSIIHVGAHDAEEHAAYSEHGWRPVVWVEMLHKKYVALKERFAGDEFNQVYHAACWDINGVTPRPYIASNFQSSSLLKPKLHSSEYPEITFAEGPDIVTSRVDRILPARSTFDFINLDVQGAELRVLKGFGDRLNHARWLYLEVNIAELYSGSVLLPQLDAFLTEHGFSRVALRLADNPSWGDALYMRRERFSNLAILEARHIGKLFDAECPVRQRTTKRPSSLASAQAREVPEHI